MKKIFTFILLMVVGTMWGITSVLATNDAGLEEITMETGNDPGGDRGELSLVEAWYNRATNSVSITLSATLGTSTIRVFSSDGFQVYSTVVDAALLGFVQFDAPTVPGIYILEIRSLSYYGVGSFTK